MADITVRGMREETVAWLKRKATLHNRSVEEEAHIILTDAVKDDLTSDEWDEKRRKFRALSDKMIAYQHGTHQTPSEVIIREMRDAADRFDRCNL